MTKQDILNVYGKQNPNVLEMIEVLESYAFEFKNLKIKIKDPNYLINMPIIYNQKVEYINRCFLAIKKYYL